MAYVIQKDDAPMTSLFDDVAYGFDPEDCRIKGAPTTGEVFKRDKFKVHKFLNPLTEGTKDWKCIDKSRGGRDAMKALGEHYNRSTKGDCNMNITKVNLKDLYFKHQDV